MVVTTRRSSKNNKQERPTLLGRCLSKNTGTRPQRTTQQQERRKNNKNDAGAWPEYTHLFKPSLSTQDSIVKKELFAARNRVGRDVTFCVDSTPIEVDIMPDEPEATADESPQAKEQITLPYAGAGKRVPRRITMDGGEGAVKDTPPAMFRKKTAPPPPPQSTIVHNPYAKRFTTNKKTRPPPSAIPAQALPPVALLPPNPNPPTSTTKDHPPLRDASNNKEENTVNTDTKKRNATRQVARGTEEVFFLLNRVCKDNP